MTPTNLRRVYSSKYERTRGKDVWNQCLRLTLFTCDRIGSCLGPKGMYKMISYNRGPEHVVKITKDAAEFLEELRIQYPPATIVSTAAKLQREEVGDGVSSFVILLGALLKNADKMLEMKIHPNLIVRGYRLAAREAFGVIDSQAGKTAKRSAEDILASVGCGGGVLTARMINLVAEAGRTIVTKGIVDKSKIRFVRKTGGSLDDSKLIQGVAVCKEKADSNMPDVVENARVVLLSGEPGVKRFEVKMQGEGLFPLKVNIKNSDDLSKYRKMEDELKMVLLEKLGLVKANVLVCERPLDDEVKCRLALQRILGLDRVSRQDMILLSEATGARMVGSLRDLSVEDVGLSVKVSVEKIDLQRYAVFEGCKGATFLLRGATTQALDEAEKAIRSALSVLRVADEDDRVVAGGGAAEMSVALQLKEFSRGFSGKEQIAIQFFADALTSVPKCLGENFGLNAVDALANLKKHHNDGHNGFGIGLNGCEDEVCWDLARVKMTVVERACEVASLMLRIDEQVVSKEIAKFHKQ